MQPINADTRAAWTVDDLNADHGCIHELDDGARRDLVRTVKRARDPDKALLDYRRADFDLGSAWPTIERALEEIRMGRGFAILRGLPRADMSAEEFELLTWAIGLHTGVARPQGRATQYLSAVKDVGTAYRSGGGRGYSSSAELDFHTDSADIVLLSCYNVARSGGMSMVTSSVTAHNVIAAERPDLADVLHQDFWFSRQQEQAPDEGPYYPNPVFDVADGLLFSKWNRNRMTTAQRLPGVPPLSEAQVEATAWLDEVLRRPALMYAMYLQPGDVQILNNHVTLHSRTEFEDHDDPALKRTLFRLWLAPPDSPRLPGSWEPCYRSVTPGTVRGGIIGQAYDESHRAYERRAAADLGMTAA
ncbi:MAG TPA: TauD/TfdA family dioxygenase [Acetobacteraceae bacterium]|nr:TauD/TfdA family dioxygenase [Acetobacteraceae bacterium]